MSVGIDFGTTNSVVARASADGVVAVAQHGRASQNGNFRSVLGFVKGEGFARPVIKAGPEAISLYLEHGSDCRLIQSIKSMAANPNFAGTVIFGRRYSMEDLIALLLKELRSSADRTLAPLGSAVIAGRPVRFAGQFADEALALARLSQAFAGAGFNEVEFVAEPLAAAYKFARRITAPQLCVIADFGGGTSDFSLVRFRRAGDGLTMDTLGTSGVGIAGDRLDFRIIEKTICPKLGMGTHYLSGGKRLPIPAHYYQQFQRWSDLSFLRAPETLRDLRALKRMAEDPEALGRLIYIIEEELGFDLYRAVTATKTALSAEESAVLDFRHGTVQLHETVTRLDFNRWISGDLAEIEQQVTGLFEGSDLNAAQVDHVFLTGGTSFVPAIRRLMAERFSSAKFSAEDEFISVAAGLALVGWEQSRARG